MRCDDRGVESDVFHDELMLFAMILEVVARRADSLELWLLITDHVRSNCAVNN